MTSPFGSIHLGYGERDCHTSSIVSDCERAIVLLGQGGTTWPTTT